MPSARPNLEEAPRRALAIKAARRAFATFSYDSVGLRDVAATAGLDLGQVVREFGAKKGLFAAALDDVVLRRPVVPFDRWPDQIADELWCGEELTHAELFGIVACSAATPEVSELIRSRSGELVGRVEANLAPGSDLPIRACVGVGIIIGMMIIRRLLRVGGNGAGDAQFATKKLSQMFRSLQGGPGARDDCEPEGVRTSATRAAILAAADTEFSRLGYDHATVRNIARAAGVDPAHVVRSFNSKEGLFLEVLNRRFRPAERQTPNVMMLNTMLIDMLLGTNGGGELDITLRSASSSVARDLLRGDIEERFVDGHAEFFGGRHARVRAIILNAAFMGGIFCQTIIRLEPALSEPAKVIAYTRDVLRLLLDD